MNYKKQFLSGTKWNAVRMITLTLTQLISVLIIGKFISPREYGLFGMVNVFIGLAYVFTDAGFSNVIIYKQENDSNKLSSVFWINVIVGVIISISICIIAPIASRYYNEPQLKNLIIISSINFIILPLGQIFISLSKKDLKFRQIALIDILSNILQIVFIIIFSIIGLGVLSLIYGKIVQSLISSTLYFLFNRKTYKINFYFNLKEIQDFISFGLFQLGDRITNYLKSNIDYLIIGKFVGAETLGIYTLAYQLIMMPIQKVNPILIDTAFPIFVKFKDNDEKINKNYYKLQQIIAYILMPIFALVFILSEEFINQFYGVGWSKAIVLLKIFSFLGIIISLGNPIGCLLNTKGRPDIGFKWNIISMVLVMVFNLIGINWGIVGVAISTTIYNLIISWPVDFYIRFKLSNMRIRDYFYNLKNPFIISLCMFFIVLIIRYCSKLIINNNSLIIIICSLSGILLYFSLIRYFNLELYREIKNKV
ncbi:MOP flippase family protein [Clostridium hydrogeniformans]|uniref:MOP flippase family protein n=1 Tax=Clostridium hydrogeniformans TaxID=349933 RepID=UPI000484C0E5|nr:MOP flippase family protein [Clostridium hydrogeniformans]